MLTHVATIRSKIITRKDEISEEIEQGIFEVEVWSDLSLALGDPKGYVNHDIAQHLAKCIKDTGLPLGERLWNVEFTTWAMSHLNYPKGFTA